MKVKEVLRKINYGAAQLPVYLQEGAFGPKRKAVSFDYNGYYFDEQDYTLNSISIRKDHIVIHYKPKY